MNDGFVLPLVAFGAGLASFFAPCILPVVPGYLSFVTGGPDASTAKRLGRTLAFVSGFSVAFVALGVLVGTLSSSAPFRAWETVFQRGAGLLIIVFGIYLTGLLKIPLLDRGFQFQGAQRFASIPFVGAFILGSSFGIGWSPCVGPFLASILLLAGAQSSVGQATFLLSVYALGLAVPFLVAGVLADRGLGLVRRMGRASQVIEIVGGITLIVIGIFVFTGSTALLTSYLVPGGANDG